MADEDSGLPSWAKGWASRATGGIVGKIAAIGVAAFAATAIVAFSLRTEVWAAFAGIVIVGGVFLYTLHRILNYAEKNPEPASMEGKDLLEWLKKRSEIAGSNQPAEVPPPEANVAPPPQIPPPPAPATPAQIVPPGENPNA